MSQLILMLGTSSFESISTRIFANQFLYSNESRFGGQSAIIISLAAVNFVEQCFRQAVVISAQ